MKKAILTIILTLFICSITYSQQWIVFFAYPVNFPTSPGHAYVSFVKRDNVTRQTVVEEVWGFFPAEHSFKAILKALVLTKGKAEQDTTWTHALRAEYDFVVEIKDPKVYEDCKKIKQVWESKNYSVVASQTCVGFVRDVALLIPGLTIPENNLINQWPKDFLINLKKQNEAVDKASRSSLSALPPKTADAGVDATDVTHSTDKQFKFYDWEKAPESFKAISKKMLCYKNYKNKIVSLFDVLTGESQIDTDCEARIAMVDLDENGIFGFAIIQEGEKCCGRQGQCTLTVYENGGIDVASILSSETPVPAKNGIKVSGANGFVKLTSNKGISRTPEEIAKVMETFSYDKTKAAKSLLTIGDKKPTSPEDIKVNTKNLVGASTPEELGKVLLKALKTNNKNLWISCIHPAADDNNRIYIEKEFTQWRNMFEEKGLSNWTQVQFSRATFHNCTGCTTTPDKKKVITDFRVEFWYKNKEFLGGFSITRVVTWQDKYFMEGCLECSANLIRNNGSR